jgi:hypothetical protein
MMLRENLDLYPPGGFGRTWTVYADTAKTVPQDLTGWSARAQVRTAPAPGGQLLAEFSVALVGAAVTVTATGAQVAGWAASWRHEDGVWDLVLVDPGGTARSPLVGGRATLHTYVSAP